MATPKRKSSKSKVGKRSSKSKVGKRRNNTKVNLPGLSREKKSGELKVPHRYSSIEKYEESKKA